MRFSFTAVKSLLMKLKAFIVLLVALFPAMLFAQSGHEYSVEERDVLKITVYGHDDMTTTVRVSGEGDVIVPLIGNVKVAGLTTQQISAKITALLADGYIIDPQVNVFIEEFRVQNIFVSGQVRKPDAYQYELDMTLIKVVTLAGGFTDLAAKNKIRITRKEKGVETTIENARLDAEIQPGDIIIVPESFF